MRTQAAPIILRISRIHFDASGNLHRGSGATVSLSLDVNVGTIGAYGPIRGRLEGGRSAREGLGAALT